MPYEDAATNEVLNSLAEGIFIAVKNFNNKF